MDQPKNIEEKSFGRASLLIIPTSNNYPMTSINTDKALELLQYHLKEVVKYQYILKFNINNIQSVM